MFALQAVAMVLLLVGQDALWVGAFIVIFGAAQGAMTLTRPSILAELYGVAHFGRISSAIVFCLTMTSTAAPLGASLIFDQVGTYQPVLWIVVMLALLYVAVAYAARQQ